MLEYCNFPLIYFSSTPVPELSRKFANFFAFFPANASGPAILGDLLSSGLGVQGMLWATSPSGTELETHVLDWGVEMLGLPAKFRSDSAGGGVIQDTASSAALCALLAARERGHHFASNDRLTLRLCVGQTHTQRRHVQRAWDRIKAAAELINTG